MRRRLGRRSVLAAVGLAVLVLAGAASAVVVKNGVAGLKRMAWTTGTTAGNSGSPGHRPVGICHHTGNSQAHEWVYITPDASGVWDGHAKGGHQDFYGPEDIIPPFTFTDSKGVQHSYPGQNLNTRYDSSLEPTANGPFTGAQILENHCVAPSSTTTTGTTQTTTTGNTTTSCTCTTTTGHTTTTQTTTTGQTTTGHTTTATVTTTTTVPTTTTVRETTTTQSPPPPPQTVTQTTTVVQTTPGPTQTVTNTVTVEKQGKPKVIVRKKVIVHIKRVRVPKHANFAYTR